MYSSKTLVLFFLLLKSFVIDENFFCFSLFLFLGYIAWGIIVAQPGIELCALDSERADC